MLIICCFCYPNGFSSSPLPAGGAATRAAVVRAVLGRFFQLAFQVDLGIAQLTRGAGAELQALYVVRQGGRRRAEAALYG